jgi:predicted RNase H-like nuclease (RuvC/YqgF family)
MTNVMVGEEWVQVIRWMEGGQAVFESVQRLLHECDRLQGATEATQKEYTRLQSECEQLRAEISRLAAESKRAQQERAETALWFTAMMNQAASRFRIERPAA